MRSTVRGVKHTLICKEVIPFALLISEVCSTKLPPRFQANAATNLGARLHPLFFGCGDSFPLYKKL
jgi:hypothetical protein